MELYCVKDSGEAKKDYHYYRVYNIDGFKFSKVLVMLDRICQSMDKVMEIRISYPSDPDNRRAALIFTSYDELTKNNVDLRYVDLIIIYGEHAGHFISAGIGLDRRTMTISARSMELEQNYFNSVSAGFIEI